MGQKVNPIGLRLGIVTTWPSRWYAEHDYADALHEDLEIRKRVAELLPHAGVSKVGIERRTKRIKVTVSASRPGIIIGRRGAERDRLKKVLEKITSKEVTIGIEEIKVPDLDAQLVAESVASQLVRRIAFRRAMRRAQQGVMQAGGLGVKIHLAGRLGGGEMSRSEWYRAGRVPLHTLRADIDYGVATARTTYGAVGVKVWIFKGEKIGDEPEEEITREEQ